MIVNAVIEVADGIDFPDACNAIADVLPEGLTFIGATEGAEG